MLSKVQFYLLTGLGILGFVLSIVSSMLLYSIRTEQNEYTERAQYIQDSVRLAVISTSLIRSRAEISAKQNDTQLRDLLNSQGISFTVKASEYAKMRGTHPESSANHETRVYTVNLPIWLGLLALIIWLGFQVPAFIQDHYNLQLQISKQESTYAKAKKMREQLDAIASGTVSLAKQGNPNATQVISDFRARGIDIDSKVLRQTGN